MWLWAAVRSFHAFEIYIQSFTTGQATRSFKLLQVQQSGCHSHLLAKATDHIQSAAQNRWYTTCLHNFKINKSHTLQKASRSSSSSHFSRQWPTYWAHLTIVNKKADMWSILPISDDDEAKKNLISLRYCRLRIGQQTSYPCLGTDMCPPRIILCFL